MKKIIAMIPARAGSKRVPKKNIRLINGKPLIQYIIEATLNSRVFSEVYVNTDDDIIKQFVKNNFPSVKIYERPKELASDSATNDDFAFDFLSNIECDSLVQLLATSPFVTPGQILNFVNFFENKKCDTLISVKRNQIESVYEGKAINFNANLHTLPSQRLTPVFTYACSLMQWDSKVFKSNYLKDLGAYHGGIGVTNFYEMDGYSTIDIDNEDDFLLAEIIAKKIENNIKDEPKYLNFDSNEVADADVSNILKSDGVEINILDNFNQLSVKIEDIVSSMPKDKSWSYTLINTPSNRATLIAQMPGEGNRRHYHSNWDEWWYIIQGSWIFEYNGVNNTIEKGEIVLIQRDNVHKITANASGLSIRLAVSRDDVDHIYKQEDYLNNE
jgi:CMP-N-acetylneuraminic acid synthetase/quercetin dioxygenase-like cupin family protein